jgi:serine/threonine protein kinase
MAPEISTGNYNKQIDIYAAGVILYEMLTGRPPFEGESAGEILMKHLTSPPDLSKLPADYSPLIGKALAKNPTQRYASMAEMTRAVEALSIEVRRVPPPVIPLPAKAAKPLRTVPVEVPLKQPAPPPPSPAQPKPAKPQEPVLTALPAVTLRGQLLELSSSMALAVLFSALATTLWTAVSQGHVRSLSDLGTVFYLTVAATWTILVPGKFWTDRRGDSWSRRVILMVLGALVGVGACWLDGWPLAVSSDWMNEAGYVSYYALAFFALRWWRMTDRRRPQRFSFAPLLASGFWGWVLVLLVRPYNQPLWGGAVVLVLTSAILQLVSPWEQPPPPASKRLRLRYA